MREIALQQTAPGLDRKQGRARPAGKEIERQAVAAADRRHFARATAVAASACARGARRGPAPPQLAADFDRGSGQALGNKNSRGRTGLDIAFDDQCVIGADHGVARHRELFRQTPRRRQTRAGANARVPDRIAQLVDQLAGQRFAPGAIQEYGYLHAPQVPPVAAASCRPGAAILGRCDGDLSKRSRNWSPQSDSQLDPSRRSVAPDLPKARAGIARKLRTRTVR